MTVLHVRLKVLQTTDEAQQLFLQSKNSMQWLTVNPEFVIEATTNSSFKAILEKSLCVIDGAGLTWCHRWQRAFKNTPRILKPLAWFRTGFSVFIGKQMSNEPQRISGSDLHVLFSEWGKKRMEPIRLFLLGGDPGAAELASKRLQNMEGIRVVGCAEGPRFALEELTRKDLFVDILKQINECDAEILLVGFKNPKQDMWINQYLPDMPKIRLAIGIGGAIDYWSDLKKRPPRWIHHMGMEWLWRLFREPVRWKRILTALSFGFRMYK